MQFQVVLKLAKNPPPAFKPEPLAVMSVLVT